MNAESVKARLQSIALVILCGGAATALLLAGLHAPRLIGFTMLAGALGGAAMLLSGNLRLSCLWGLLLTAPLDLSKRFMIVPHMGGEAAFRIELVDFFIIGLLFFQLNDVVMGRRPRMRFPRVLWWWVALAGLGLVTVAIGPLRTTPAHEVFRIVKSLTLMFVLVNEVVRVRQFYHVALALMTGVMLEAAIAILQWAFDLRLGLQALGEADEETVDFLARATLNRGEAVYRVGALIGHANLLAAYNALFLPLAIALLFTKVKLPVKVFFAATALMGEAALVLTLSRAGWIAFAAGGSAVVVLTLFHKRMRTHYTLMRLGLVAGAALPLIALSGPIMSRLFRSDPGAVNVRFEWLRTAWEMIKARPIMGFGLNNYVFAQAPYTPEGTPGGIQAAYGDYWPVVHNIYALTWAEQGTVGLLLFLGMHVHVFIVAIRNLRTRNDLLFAINIGCICGFGAIMIDGLASFYIRNPDCARTWWIVIAMIWAVHYWRRANESPHAVEHKPAGEVAPTDADASAASHA